MNTKKLRPVKLSKTKRILTIVIPIVSIDSNWEICMISNRNIADYLNVD